MKRITASPGHEIAYQDLAALVGKHAAKVSPAEMLAIAANMIGKLIALQDQRTTTIDEAIQIVWNNIAEGNQEALEQVQSAGGRPT